jgi:hypothetical protein
LIAHPYFTIPDKDTVCGLPPPLSLMESRPMAPGGLGNQLTVMVQDCPAPTLVPQLFVCEKGPVTVTPLMVSAVAPRFVRVTCCAPL